MENVGVLGDVWENGQGPNEHFEIEIDEDDDRDADADADGALDGGVALNPEDAGGSSSKRRSTECDLVRCLLRRLQ
jgi:hypothetical protein